MWAGAVGTPAQKEDRSIECSGQGAARRQFETPCLACEPGFEPLYLLQRAFFNAAQRPVVPGQRSFRIGLMPRTPRRSN